MKTISPTTIGNNTFFSAEMHKVSMLCLLAFLLAFYLSGCKKSCITCFNQGTGQTNYKYDSSTTVSYNPVLHRYDTLLVKIDTIYKFDSVYILHYCPGSQEYNSITSSESLFDGSYVCSYDPN
jgi:hypothetical protein